MSDLKTKPTDEEKGELICQKNARTADQPTSSAISEWRHVVNAVMSGPTKTTGVQTETAILAAKIRIQVIASLLIDLVAWRTGDEARFNRMVDGKQAQLCSPDGHLRGIKSLCANPDVQALAPDLALAVQQELIAIGLAEAAEPPGVVEPEPELEIEQELDDGYYDPVDAELE